MLIYKLTDQNLRTHNGFQYKKNRWITAPNHDPDKSLCSDGWLHAYEHPLIAVFMNPVHARIKNPKLFECKWKGNHKKYGQLKLGVESTILKKEIGLPTFTPDELVTIAINCALLVYDNQYFVDWTNNWLSGTDRSASNAARSASNAARSVAWAARSAAWAAESAAASSAAWSAANSARSAGREKQVEITLAYLEEMI